MNYIDHPKHSFARLPPTFKSPNQTKAKMEPNQTPTNTSTSKSKSPSKSGSRPITLPPRYEIYRQRLEAGDSVKEAHRASILWERAQAKAKEPRAIDGKKDGATCGQLAQRKEKPSEKHKQEIGKRPSKPTAPKKRKRHRRERTPPSSDTSSSVGLERFLGTGSVVYPRPRDYVINPAKYRKTIRHIPLGVEPEEDYGPEEYPPPVEGKDF